MKDDTRRITEGIIWKEMLLFFLPLFMGSLFQQLYNTVDAVIVGRFVGKEALSAVGGATGTLIGLVVNFLVAVSSGCTILIAQNYGARKEEEVRIGVHTAMTLAAVAGVCASIVGVLFAPQLLHALSVPEDIFEYASIYIRIYFAGLTANLIYNMGSGILRAIGDAKRPLYFLIVSSIVNIALDLLFVVVLHMEVVGVGLATILSQLVSALLVCAVMVRTTDIYRLDIRKLGMHFPTLARMIRIGIPSGGQSLMYGVSNLAVQATVNEFGTNTIAAWTAYVRLDSFYWIVLNCLGIATMTFAGQNFGAGNYKRVRKCARTCLGICAVLTVFISVLMCTFSKSLCSLFSTDADVVALARSFIWYLMPWYIGYIVVEVCSATLRGIGNTFMPMVLTCFGICVFRLLWIALILPIRRDMYMLILNYPIAWFFASALFLVYYIYYIRKANIR